MVTDCYATACYATDCYATDSYACVLGALKWQGLHNVHDIHKRHATHTHILQHIMKGKW